MSKMYCEMKRMRIKTVIPGKLKTMCICAFNQMGRREDLEEGRLRKEAFDAFQSVDKWG